MNPAVQIEQAMTEAQKQDRELRQQAARVIAHRSEVEMKLARAMEDSAKTKGQAAQALKNADAAMQAGNAGDVDKWNRAAQALAMKLQSNETMVTTLKDQFGKASQQSDLAKEQVNQNAMRLQELSARRIELLGKLEQAKMQEQVNRTLEQLNRPMEQTGPTMTEIEDKINRRMAQANAHGELEASSIEGAARELEVSTAQLDAQARLEELRTELGLPAASAPAAAKEAIESASDASERPAGS